MLLFTNIHLLFLTPRSEWKVNGTLRAAHGTLWWDTLSGQTKTKIEKEIWQGKEIQCVTLIGECKHKEMSASISHFWLLMKSHHIGLEKRFGLATIDYNVPPERAWALNRGHIVSSFFFFFLPLQIECQLFRASWKICCGVSRQADGIKEFLLQSDCTLVLINDTFLSFFNGKHNFGFLRRERKSQRASLTVQKYLVEIWHSSPFANVNVFPYMTKILLLFTLCDYWYLYAHAQMTIN